MKILFITTGPWGTGSFNLVKCLSKELIKLGHEVKVFFPDSNLASEDKEEYYGNSELYQIWQFPIKKGGICINNFPLMIPDPHPRNPEGITFRSLSRDQQNLYEEELYKELSSLIQQFRPDIIECHHIWYPAWIIKQIGFPSLLLSAHHSDQMGFRFDEKARDKAIASAQYAKKIIAISESVKNEVFKLYNVDKEKVELIANCYDEEIFKAIDTNKKAILDELKIKLDPKARIISFSAKLSLTKGIDILLQANRLLQASEDIYFIIMGAGCLDDVIENLPPDSYRLENIYFIGQQTQQKVAQVHNISEFSVMPSREEGFGIACLEAMACGLPVITTRSGGPEEFAVGKIINIESPLELAKAIKELLDLSETETSKLKHQALEAASRFSIDSIALKHLALYDSIRSKGKEELIDFYNNSLLVNANDKPQYDY
ncbi:MULTISPECIES: glycosyltransferase family 4 protein [Legionella]|uniref:Putative Starch synthase n=1 Tax=Legionella drozanskii LLAP-1 TaxID=1212489 RepID=A0A0W0SLR3_9GAMM|nr:MULTISPECIES: glycosyltransferase family 4 protein [Legionella]KTC84254.1 putative Starch synthase [Legionella drozanskii LLAP-1]PJE07194.1 MAG: glycosyltransferase family 4 protein [Legionella sp.]